LSLNILGSIALNKDIPVNNSEKAYAIAKEKMFDNDAFSQWLGIEIMDLNAGKAVLRMTVRPEMTQGFGLAHGGITYSLADSALAFASNAHGRKSVSIETSISHLVAVKAGEILTATATEESLSNKIGVYHIKITNQDGKLVALFKGTVYRTTQEWLD
jgi:acyl-CoA thioesterase